MEGREGGGEGSGEEGGGAGLRPKRLTQNVQKHPEPIRAQKRGTEPRFCVGLLGHAPKRRLNIGGGTWSKSDFSFFPDSQLFDGPAVPPWKKYMFSFISSD